MSDNKSKYDDPFFKQLICAYITADYRTGKPEVTQMFELADKAYDEWERRKNR